MKLLMSTVAEFFSSSGSTGSFSGSPCLRLKPTKLSANLLRRTHKTFPNTFEFRPQPLALHFPFSPSILFRKEIFRPLSERLQAFNQYSRQNKTPGSAKKLTDFSSKSDYKSGKSKFGAGNMEKTKQHLKNAPVKSSVAYLQILGTGLDTEDTVPSIFLFFDNRRFVFNAGEGMQRFCLQHKIKFTKIDQVFLTRINSETTGGIPGFLLTLAGLDATVKISGPSNLDVFFRAMRTFIPQASFVHSSSFGTEASDVDDGKNTTQIGKEILVLDDHGIVQISAIILQPEIVVPTSLEPEDSRLIFKRKRSWSQGMDAEVFQKESSIQKEDESCSQKDFSVVYICQLPTTQGKFDPVKAKGLGLSPGKKYGLLQGGHSVMSDDGSREILPSDVMTAPLSGAVILLVDCPTIEHFLCLEKCSALERFFNGNQANLIVHLSPMSVTKDQRYKLFMEKFGPNAQHILSGHGRSSQVPPVLMSSARVTTRLNFVCPRLFPAPGLGLPEFGVEWVGKVVEGNEEPETTVAVPDRKLSGTGPVTLSQNLMKFNLRPLSFFGLDLKSVPPQFSVLKVQQEITQFQPEIQEASRKVALLWNDQAPLHPSLLKVPKSPKKENKSWKASQVYQESMEDEWIAAESMSKQTEALKLTGNVSNTEKPMLSSSSGFPVSPPLVTSSTQGSLSGPPVPECLRGIGRNELEIVFLGTGSSMPSKYRNVSAILLNRISTQSTMLLDCGEGTYGQIIRRYGRSNADLVIQRLKLVWISHIHADHHVGILRIISTRQKLLQRENEADTTPLLVIGPTQLGLFLEAYKKLERIDYIFLDCRETLKGTKRGLLSGRIAENMIQGRSGKVEGLVGDSRGGFRAELGRNERGQPGRNEGKIGGVLDTGSARFGEEDGGKLNVMGANGKRRDNDAEAMNGNGSRFLRDSQEGRGGRGGRGGLTPYWVQGGGSRREINSEESLLCFEKVLGQLGLKTLESVPVVHCRDAFGVVLEAKNVTQNKEVKEGWKIAYSGDTRPCEAMVEASRGATVLIHEATFDDGMKLDAVAKRHSMTGEAIRTGMEANVYRIILTHFSQRYPKVPKFDKSYTDRTCVAFDMMTVNLADLEILPAVLPSLRCLFKEEFVAREEGMDNGAESVL